MVRPLLLVSLVLCTLAEASSREKLVASLDRSWELNKILAREASIKGDRQKDATAYLHPDLELDKFQKAAAQVEAAKEFAGACRELSSAKEPLPYGREVGIYSEGEVKKYCERSKSPKSALLEALHQRQAWQEAHYLSIANATLKGNQKGRSKSQQKDPVTEVDLLKKKYQPAYDALGEPFPEKFFAGYLGTMNAAQALLKGAEHAPLFTEATEKNAAIDAVARRIAKTIPAGKGASFRDSRVWPGTDVEKNDFGAPMYKYRTVRVVVQLSGESFCRAYDVIAQSDHMGGGRYGDWYFLAGDGLGGFDKRTFDRGACP